MKRTELEDLRSKAMLALKSLFVASLDTEFQKHIHPAQVAAATALHQACCRELQDGLFGYNFSMLMDELGPIDYDLDTAVHATDPEERLKATINARTLFQRFYNHFGEIEYLEGQEEAMEQ